MKSRRWRSPTRLLAPLALIAFGVAFAMVWSSSKVETHHSHAQPPAAATGTTTTTAVNKYAHRRSYTVRTGDTLGGIAEKTGVAITTLEGLNPGLDPQALVAGQKLKLRE
jgi:LysM repeat protein